MLLFQRTWVHFPALISGSSEKSVTPAPEASETTVFCAHLHSCTYTHTQMYIYEIKNKKLKQIRKRKNKFSDSHASQCYQLWLQCIWVFTYIIKFNSLPPPNDKIVLICVIHTLWFFSTGIQENHIYLFFYYNSMSFFKLESVLESEHKQELESRVRE